jgi:energy-coupling factor transport system ATP-binding protein
MMNFSTPEHLPLQIHGLTFQYKIRDIPAIKDISFDLHEGELLLLAGASGCGKTTLMRCINGLIPRTYHGELSGSIQLYGKDATQMAMADLSQQVGTILQDPERQIIGSYVLNEVAFGLENLAVPREEIHARIDESLAYLGISHLKGRETFSLSGGEKQKVALAGVLAMRPRILLLDEPLASLDPASSYEALHLFRRLADEGIAILLVEHRVDEVLAIHPDTVIYMEDGIQTYYGPPEGVMDRVDYQKIKLPAKITMERARTNPAPVFQPAIQPLPEAESLVEFKDVSFQYAADLPEVLHDINFQIRKGDVIAILGHNGAGKSTLVKHILGLLKPTSGSVILEGKDTRQTTVATNAKTVGYVFQSPSQMLFAPTVEQELEFGPRNLRMPDQSIVENVTWALDTVHLAEERKTPPLALSFGQQKRISIASILSMRSRILMMDEPTAGQDYWNYTAFMDSIIQMPGFDSILFITHDIDLAVIYANRILLIYSGKIVADGSPYEVLSDEDRLKECRVLPSSLLRLNLEMYPKSGRFMRAEHLAHLQ